MPTVVEPEPRFVTVPLDPWLVALAAAVPGSGRPTEMWIGAADPTRLPAVRAALAEEPFRFAEVTARADLVAEREGDPLSRAIVWTLLRGRPQPAWPCPSAACSWAPSPTCATSAASWPISRPRA